MSLSIPDHDLTLCLAFARHFLQSLLFAQTLRSKRFRVCGLPRVIFHLPRTTCVNAARSGAELRRQEGYEALRAKRFQKPSTPELFRKRTVRAGSKLTEGCKSARRRGSGQGGGTEGGQKARQLMHRWNVHPFVATECTAQWDKPTCSTTQLRKRRMSAGNQAR